MAWTPCSCRPASPLPQQAIFEVDTGAWKVWNGTAWADAAEEWHALDGNATLEASVPAGADRAEAALAAS